MASVDIFQPRKMLEYYEQSFPTRTFLRDTFFPTSRTFMTKAVDLDIVKGKRKVAAYVRSSKLPANLIERDGFSVKSYAPPYIKEKMVTTAEQLMNRAPGENIYSPMSPAQKAAKQLTEDLDTLRNRCVRAEEIQCRDSMFDGAITFRDKDGNALDTVSFGLSATHKITLTGTDLWTDDASDPHGQLMGWKRMNSRDSGIASEICILGSDAYDAFYNNKKLRAALDLLKLDNGSINPSELPNGVTYIGRLKDIGVDFYTYDEYYTDYAGTVQPMIPAKKIWMGSPRARFERLYGAIDDLDCLNEAAWFPKSWKTEGDQSARYVMVQSAPMCVPVEIDSFTVAQVIA